MRKVDRFCFRVSKFLYLQNLIFLFDCEEIQDSNLRPLPKTVVLYPTELIPSLNKMYPIRKKNKRSCNTDPLF